MTAADCDAIVARVPAHAIMVAEAEHEYLSEADSLAELDKRNLSVVSDASVAYIVRHIPERHAAKRLREMIDACTPGGNPDWRARESGLKLYYAYRVGLPVQRQEIVQHRITTPSLSGLLKSPESRAAVRRMLAESEGEQGEAITVTGGDSATD